MLGRGEHVPRDEEGAMEYPYGGMPDPVYESWDEERLLIESELEMQIWRWALLEAHLREASQVYVSLMGSPLAPRTQGELLHHSLEEWHPAEGGSAVDAPRRNSGRSQGRRQRRRTLQHQRRSSRFPRQGHGMEQAQE